MSYSQLVLEHFYQPRNIGIFNKTEINIHAGKAGILGNGDVVHLQVKLDGKKIAAVKALAHGSPYTIACVSFITDWAIGQEIDAIFEKNYEDFVGQLELPSTRKYCVLLVLEALKKAILFKRGCI